MSNPKRLYVDVHVLQTVPPSCVNRDDTGSPKTAVYGGVTRARVSSQCWKRATRLMLKEEATFEADDFGNRTKALAQEVAKCIRTLDPEIREDKAEGLAADTINLAGKNPIVTLKKATSKRVDSDADEEENGEAKNEALFFVTPRQILSVAKLAVAWNSGEKKPDRKDVQNALSLQAGIDIALFGRMVAQAPDLNVDACVQVAHSISTHKVSNEYDYFTAVDDLAPEDTTGASHIGTVEYNSATLYRYATVAVHALEEQLHQNAIKATEEFVRAFVYSMPTGKQNTFANRTLPDAVMVTLRTDQPVNLVGAYEKPVTTGEGGYMEASALKLKNYAETVYQEFAGAPALTLSSGKVLGDVGLHLAFPQLLAKLTETLESRMGKGDDGR